LAEGVLSVFSVNPKSEEWVGRHEVHDSRAVDASVYSFELPQDFLGRLSAGPYVRLEIAERIASDICFLGEEP